MARLILYYAHPGQRFSHANKAMFDTARRVEGLSVVDLYAEYPRHNIDVDKEQERVQEHDIIVMQFPMFWYSTPSLLKEWQDLVLEHGFAYGDGGDKLNGKSLMLAVTAAGSADAYSAQGYQRYPLRTFLTPLEQTAQLCGMQFLPPYVLHDSLQAPHSERLEIHSQGYADLLAALRDDRVRYASEDIEGCVVAADVGRLTGGAA